MEQIVGDEINETNCSKKEAELDAVDPETIAQLDNVSASDDAGPSPAEFEGFVSDVDTEPVSSEPAEEVPIDASMDELFAD